MMLTPEKKEKLKKLLLALSSDEEKDTITQGELLANLASIIEGLDKKTEERFGAVGKKYDEVIDMLAKTRGVNTKHSAILLETINEFSDSLNKKLDEIKAISNKPVGDVYGPNKAKDSNFAAFDGSGKKLKDSGFTVIGTHKITVGTKEPTDPQDGDVWIKPIQ